MKVVIIMSDLITSLKSNLIKFFLVIVPIGLLAALFYSVISNPIVRKRVLLGAVIIFVIAVIIFLYNVVRIYLKLK